MAAGDELSSLPFLQNRPHLHDHLTFAWNAFKALSEGRNYASETVPSGPERTPIQIMRPLPITFEAISKYAERYGIAEIEEFEEFSYTVRVLDQAYIQHQLARFHA